MKELADKKNQMGSTSSPPPLFIHHEAPSRSPPLPLSSVYLHPRVSLRLLLPASPGALTLLYLLFHPSLMFTVSIQPSSIIHVEEGEG